jgi:hypothetical protein
MAGFEVITHGRFWVIAEGYDILPIIRTFLSESRSFVLVIRTRSLPPGAQQRHWYRLLDLCGITDTLIGDSDGIYHPALFNNRLILGLKRHDS